MATKFQFRRGNASAIPSLDVAEPGYDIDTKTIRVGDGTSAPPRTPTTKATGSFDFSAVTDFRIPRVILGVGSASAVSLYFNPQDADTGFFSPASNQLAASISGTQRWLLTSTGMTVTGNIDVSGNVDGVDISKLNPTNVHGILVKKGNNDFTVRTLTNGTGIAAFKDDQGAANPGGVTGNIIIQIADNATLPGNGAIKIPAGTTGDRTSVTATNGHLRYNTTKKSVEGFIDGEWRELVDYVEGKVVLVPSQFASIQDAIQYFENRSTRSNVFIDLAAGAHSVGQALSPGSRTNRVFIRGVAPIDINLHGSTPVVSVTGSLGNYSVTYKLNGAVPDGLTTDHSILIHDIEGSGEIPTGTNYTYAGDDLIEILSANKARIQFDPGKNVNDYYAVNDYIMSAGVYETITTKRISSIINSRTAECDSVFADSSTLNSTFHRKYRRITGTVSANNTATLTGSGTSFLTELNVGDLLIQAVSPHQTVRVLSIESNTSLTLETTVNLPNGTIALQHVEMSSHKGCWKISSIDTINQTITVINTSRSTPPPKFGVRKGRIRFLMSTILFTPSTMMTVNESEFIGFQNLTIRYTGSTPTSPSNGIYLRGGQCQISGVGFNGTRVYGTGCTIFGNGFSVSAANFNHGAITFTGNSIINVTTMIATGNKNTGIITQQSSVETHTLVSSNNGGYGLNTTIFSDISTAKCDVDGNGYTGVLTSNMSFMRLGVFTTIGNGHYNNINPGWAGQETGLAAMNGAHIQNNEACSIIAGNNKNGVASHTLGTVILLKTLVAANRADGVYLYQEGKFVSYGNRIVNNEGSGAYAVYQSSFINSHRSTWISDNKLDGIYANVGSFVCLSSCTVKKSANFGTNRYDIRAINNSKVYSFKTAGSAAANALASYPILNSGTGHNASLIYGTAV